MTRTDSVLLQTIKHTHPQLVEETRIQIEPRLTDLSIIQNVATHFGTDSESRLHFIACVLKLYDPAVFVSDKQLKRGIAPKIAEVLGCTVQNVSYHADTVRHFYRFYGDFQNVVDGKFNQIMSDDN